MSNYYVYGSELNDPQVLSELQKNIKIGNLLTDLNIDDERSKVEYPQYLDAFKPEEENTYKNFVNVDGAKNDKGHLGDPSFKNLFPEGKKYTKFDLSPNYGTEVEGIQLSELDDAGKNDLALFLETRGLAVFRNQDLRDKSPKFSVDFGKYFGPLHIHPAANSGEEPELLVTYRPEGDSSRYAAEFANKTSAVAWHSDISFEEYPSSFSFFVALEVPEAGGDTVFIDTREAYKRLSPKFQAFLETLTAVHSNYYQNKGSRLRGLVARIKEDYFTEHPLVRTHPVTGEKSLFFSRAFITKIKGVKPSESAAILNFLDAHINSPEFQVRATHHGGSPRTSKTVIAWDNRISIHTAIADFLAHDHGRRHHYRITVLGENPYLDVEGKKSNGEANGNSNGHSNGQSNGHSNGHSNGVANGTSNGH